MRAGRKIAAMVLTGMFSLSALTSSFAAEKPDGMDDAIWARLQDGKIEYDEIENLVLYFNPNYRQAIEYMDASTGLQDMERSAEELKAEIKNIKKEADYAEEEGDVLTYMYNTALANTLEKQALRQLRSGINMINSSKKENFRPVRRQLTSALQQMMIGYHMALSSKELTDTAAELADSAYQSTITQKNLGMATDTAVQNAEKSLVAARQQQQSLDSTLTSLRQNLSIMTGGTADTPIEIGPIPAPDLSRIATMNPDTDIDQAIPYCQEIKSLRHTSEASQALYENKTLSLAETNGKLKTKLESLYQKVLETKTSYEAAQTALESATITMNGNDLKYQMGMLGRLEYLQTKVGYLQQKMTYDMAVLNLKQAIENYDWALYGIVELE